MILSRKKKKLKKKVCDHHMHDTRQLKQKQKYKYAAKIRKLGKDGWKKEINAQTLSGFKKILEFEMQKRQNDSGSFAISLKIDGGYSEARNPQGSTFIMNWKGPFNRVADILLRFD